MLNQQKPRTFIPSKYTRYTVHVCIQQVWSCILWYNYVSCRKCMHTVGTDDFFFNFIINNPKPVLMCWGTKICSLAVVSICMHTCMNQFLLAQEFEIDRAMRVSRLPPEPESNDPSSITVLLRLPSGHRLERRFNETDKLEVHVYLITSSWGAATLSRIYLCIHCLVCSCCVSFHTSHWFLLFVLWFQYCFRLSDAVCIRLCLLW